jgi:hypothetical protein
MRSAGVQVGKFEPPGCYTHTNARVASHRSHTRVKDRQYDATAAHQPAPGAACALLNAKVSWPAQITDDKGPSNSTMGLAIALSVVAVETVACKA